MRVRFDATRRGVLRDQVVHIAPVMDRLLRIASLPGRYAEEFDVETGRHPGNFPQVFSRLALIEPVGHIVIAEGPPEY
jgi:GH15 family glucan-1,4-alpha-glucosidase